MIRLSKGIAFFSIVCLTCFDCSISAVNSSRLSSVFLRAVGSTTLEELFNGSSSTKSANSTCFDASDYNELILCLESQCFGAAEIARLYNLSSDTLLDEQALTDLAPAVLYTHHRKQSCISIADSNTNSSSYHQRPSTAAVWGYSFLFVTVINLCSLTGILVLPCIKMTFYKLILMFMVALAVGTLAGSAVLVLIPEAFELTSISNDNLEGDESSHKYIWTASSVVGGIYLFFIIERIMRMINVWRENTKDKKRQDEMATRGTLTSSFTRHAPQNASLKLKDPDNLHLEQSPSSHCLCNIVISHKENSPEKSCADISDVAANIGGDGCMRNTLNELDGGDAPIENNRSLLNGHSRKHHLIHHAGHVAPVAYMVIFGDGFHNFIDGLSIGAAFTDSILLGISVSVAVMCEELPHELGDFAILLNAGMRLQKALMYNFLSSLMCYLGLIIGIVVGENTTAHTWIFGLAGGMFLYISLVDMMPEMNSTAETAIGKQFGMLKLFLLQNVGLLTGYTVILLLALYGGEINFE